MKLVKGEKMAGFEIKRMYTGKFSTNGNDGSEVIAQKLVELQSFVNKTLPNVDNFKGFEVVTWPVSSIDSTNHFEIEYAIYASYTVF